MSYKIYLYVIFTFLSVFAISGIDFKKFIIPGRNVQAKILALILAFSLGYLLTNYVIDFLNL
jgi:uncharacterized integral membrane protein (TIGR02327 family)